MRIVEFTDSNFINEVIQSDLPVLVEVHTGWCEPCRQLKPVIRELADEYGRVIKFGKLDADTNPFTTESYQVRSVPTILMFQDGAVVERLTGKKTKEELLAKIMQLTTATNN